MDTNKNRGSNSILGILLLLVFILFSVYFAQRAYLFQQESIALKELKQDHAEIHHIRYGIFNLGLWKGKVSDILSAQIDQFEISPQARKQIKSYILNYLNDFYEKQIKSGDFLDQFLDQYAQSSGNKKEINLFGFKLNLNIKDIVKKEVKSQLANIDIDQTMTGIADQIMAELQRNEPLIKEAIRNQMTDYLQGEGQVAGTGINTSVLEKKYACKDLEQCEQWIDEQIALKTLGENSDKKHLILMSAIALFLLVVLSFLPRRFKLLYWVVVPGLTILSLMLLALGLTLPMIDLYAGLENVHIQLLGEAINFGDQVMFFQSKSILEVVELLTDSRHWDARVVGYLILAFSILFPIVKTLATFLMAYFDRMARNKIIKKLALTLSKWSMADVFVVGLFMAFIGFNTVVDSQLLHFNNPSESFDLITKNKTMLRPGAIFFTGFVIVSLCLSTLMIWQNKHKETDAYHRIVE